MDWNNYLLAEKAPTTYAPYLSNISLYPTFLIFAFTYYKPILEFYSSSTAL